MQAYHVSAHPLAAQTCLEARWGPTISQVVRMMRAARLAGSQALAALPYSGEMARLRGRGGDELTALIELVFEEVRQQYYPKRIFMSVMCQEVRLLLQISAWSPRVSTRSRRLVQR